MIRAIQSAPQLNTSFNCGVEVWKKNFGPLLLAFLLTVLISAASCGICSAPMSCGLLALILGAMRDPSRPMQVGDVFNGFKVFGPSFLATVVITLASFAVSTILGIVPVVGWMAGIVIGWVLSPAMISWALLLSTDQDATVGEAISTPFGLLGDKRFWSFAGVHFLASLVGGLGALLCGIGIFVTMPLASCIAVAAYEEMFTAPAPAPMAALPQA